MTKILDLSNPHAIVAGLLSHFGYEPEKIDEDPTRKTPDFRCATEDAVYAIELKSREEDSEEEAKRRPILEGGQVYGFSQPVGRRNAVAGLIDEAVEQLVAYAEPNVFRLACLYTGIKRVEMRRTQFKAALYGMESVTSLDWAHWKYCLYFTHSDFFRHRDTFDGAIVVSPSESGFDASLFLNDHAPRYQQLSVLALPRKFGQGLFLPDERERAGEVLIADCDADRGHPQGVIRYLCKKYGLRHLQAISMGYHEGTVLADARKAPGQ